MIFLGLITHRRTSYPESRGPRGLLDQLRASLERSGTQVQVSIHDADLYERHPVPLTNAEVRASIDAELNVEHQWRIHVNPRQSLTFLSIFMALRKRYRRLRLAPPWLASSEATASGARMLKRLINIEQAHMELMQEAVASNSNWSLIVEDDALLPNVEAFAQALLRFTHAQTPRSQPKYVNVSRSFDDPLGISVHFTPIGQWDADSRELAADRPLTNTVCAVLYRTDFLAELLRELRTIPSSPVLPIDWKINAAILALQDSGTLGSGDCWFVEPGPIYQGSMLTADR